jgi:ribonucleotide reductase alpha subunit
LWNSSVKTQIIAHNGSVQKIKEIPDEMKNLYKTVWEISQKKIIDLAIGRAPFIDQSQSLNIHLADPNFSKITSMHFYSWKNGLKTGMYYLRSRPAVDAIKFTVNVEELLKATESNDTDSVLKALNKKVEDEKVKEEKEVSKVETSTTTKMKDYDEPEGCINCSG